MILARRMRPAAPSTRQRFALRRRLPRGAPARPPASSPAAAAAGGVALGALLAYFADPRSGPAAADAPPGTGRALAVRRGERRAVGRARRAESHAVGIARRTFNPRRFRRREPLDDVSLAHKVESELSRRAGVPKGEIVVNAEDGVVFLRGVIERHEDVQSLEDATRRIAGVRGWKNLLHPPGTPAPASRPKLERRR